MKKIGIALIAILICASFIAYTRVSGIGSNGNNSYNIHVELNTEGKALVASEDVTYVNNTNINLNEIYFHIYPNAYRTSETTPVVVFNGNIDSSYPEGFNPGSLEINNILSGNNKLLYTIEGKDKTILRVKLPQPLKPGNKTEISIKFKEVIPLAIDRFGYYYGTYNFGNWYPIAAVYDETGWNLDPYYNLGDPFYSDTSNYNVQITVPENYVVAATGSESVSSPKDHKRIYTYTENMVRDFAWVAGNDFKVTEKNVDGINIRCYSFYHLPDTSQTMIATTENTLRTFNGLFGKYPYKNFSVVATNFVSGMEYPGLVYVNSDFAYNQSTLANTIVHETAHQWWYGVIGDNEVDEAWLDESFATFSELLYQESLCGRTDAADYYNYGILGTYISQKSLIKPGEVVLMPLTKFNSWMDYGALVYRKGAIMLYDLRSRIGNDMFLKILQSYYKDYQFKNVKTENFISEVEKITNKDWKTFFDEWLLRDN